MRGFTTALQHSTCLNKLIRCLYELKKFVVSSGPFVILLKVSCKQNNLHSLYSYTLLCTRGSSCENSSGPGLGMVDGRFVLVQAIEIHAV